MDAEIPVLAGYLNVPTQSSFSLNRISKKKPCHRYCLLFKSSRHGIERLEICESKEDKNPKIITLENCVKITQEPSPANLIQIVTKTGTLTLNTLTDEDLKEWVNALQSVAFHDKSIAHSSHAAIEEDNDLYCSSFGDGLFIITLIPSETSMRCNIEPKTYMMHLTATELQLKSAEDISMVIAKWPYRFIRKYGYRDGKFTFEAGRKCSTGEGVFTLDHTNPQEVFRCMSAKMKSMRKLINSDSLNSIECGEQQLSAAASMEPGSRSPLPPSPSNQHAADFEINSTQSCVSLRGFISSSDSLNNFSVNSNVAAPLPPPNSNVKHIPSKPPRKPLSLDRLGPAGGAPTTPAHSSVSSSSSSVSIFDIKSSSQPNCDKFKKYQSYEPVSITTSADPSKTGGSTVILKPPTVPSTADAMRKLSNNNNNTPPDLPVRNESTKLVTTPTSTTAKILERDYESIETITDAWKTMGLGEIKHTERIAPPTVNDDDLIDFGWQRTLSQREKGALKETFLPPVKTPKIIDIDIGEGGNSTCAATEDTYDRLDFLSPNHNKTSSGYKTIVTVSSPANRQRCSPPPANDYELIASPDIQPCRKADDSHLGYGVLRKSTSGGMVKATSSTPTTPTSTTANNNSIAAALSSLPASESSASRVTTGKGLGGGEPTSPLDHRNYNGLNYTIVSKPKRV